MTAHMDAVTGLAIDPHGLYLLSGSECAVCVRIILRLLPPSLQVMTAHYDSGVWRARSVYKRSQHIASISTNLYVT